MAELFTYLPTNVMNMGRDQLLQYFPEGTDNSYLMRSIIMSEKEYPSEKYDRSLRSLWYSTVKPTLDKLGKLTAVDNTEEGLTKWDATLSRYVADLLRRGYLTYKDLYIVDASRNRENPEVIYYSTDRELYCYQASVAPYSYIILATEKDTVYKGELENMAKLLGCSCISCKGQNSLGAMEDLVRGMDWEGTDIDTVYIISLTDYDPAGYYIAEALETQARDVLNALGHADVDVVIDRIGIEPHQLSPEMVRANMYSPKESNLDKWLDRTGGIDGQRKGLELDALKRPQRLTIFVNAIMKYIDPDVYTEFLKKSYIRKKCLEGLAPKVARLINGIIETMEEEVSLRNFDIKQLVLKGYDSLPIETLCSHNKDMDIQAELLSYFNLAKAGGPEDYDVINYMENGSWRKGKDEDEDEDEDDEDDGDDCYEDDEE